MALKELALAEDEISIFFDFERNAGIPVWAMGAVLLDLDRIARETLGTGATLALTGIESGSLRLRFKVTAGWASVAVAIVGLIPIWADYFADEPDPVVYVINATQTTHININSVHLNETVDMRPEKRTDWNVPDRTTRASERRPVDMDGQVLANAIHEGRELRLRGKFYLKKEAVVFVADNGAEFYVAGNRYKYADYMTNMYFEVIGKPELRQDGIWLYPREIV